jgi:monoamine oxidase
MESSEGTNTTIPSDGPKCDVPELRDLPVAIFGADVAGLRTAKVLDYLGTPYDILEASERYGGRFFTYHFTKEEESGLKHDYFDFGR